MLNRKNRMYSCYYSLILSLFKKINKMKRVGGDKEWEVML